MSGQAPPRVLVFDSGVGGLSVAACIHRHLSGLEIVYLADNAGFPYGDKSETVVIERCCTLIARALQLYPSDVIVVACNTASTVVLPHLRAMTEVPVVGVVPAIKPAAARTVNRRMGLLATPATVRRPYLDRLVEEFAGDCKVERIGHPGLVRWAEDLVSGVEVPFAELREAMKPFRDADVDTVVLGCTHYPLLLESLKLSLPSVRFWVDSGEAIARRVAWLMDQAGQLALAKGQACRTGDHPVVAALFSGPAPEGIVPFMTGLGLAPKLLQEGWPGEAPEATATGSA
ncbi:glutamate racemase [Marinobacter maroccanus]|uniref:Glutamate racemase n=1 Tax=Marinobacter maroccanus TaxID=2055143 RepID=A0A2S5Z9B0_9GAMM|nr:glutamate racemase [Marinobacter maroccanus]PPI83950.1 glutamate racemase [Marinobacter maroccanus]